MKKLAPWVKMFDPMFVNLETGFNDGVALFHLLEALQPNHAPKEPYNPNPQNFHDMREVRVAALAFARELGVKKNYDQFILTTEANVNGPCHDLIELLGEIQQHVMPETKRQFFVFTLAYEIVRSNLDIVEGARGRDIVLFVGQSQTGKSTTINALLQVLFTWERTRPRRLIPSGPAHAPMGTGGTSTTMIPAVYLEPNSGLAFVDIRGVAAIGSNDDEDGILASEILLEMIVRAARSIRIIGLVRYSHLDQLSTFRPLMQRIGELLQNPTIPIFWLFIHHPSTGLSGRSIQDQNDLDLVLEDIADKIISHYNDLGDKLATEPPMPDSPTLLEWNAISSLKTCLDHTPSLVAYFDPTSQWSIAQISSLITALPVTSLSDLNFGPHSAARDIFDRYFEQRLVPETILLRLYPSFATHSRAVINELDPQILANELDAQYSCGINYERDALTRIDRELIDLRDRIARFNELEEVYYRDAFNESTSWYKWYRKHETKLPPVKKAIRYCRWSSNLEPDTKQIQVLKDGTSEISIMFASDWFTDCRGSVSFYIFSRDRPQTARQIREWQNQVEGLERERLFLERRLQLTTQAHNETVMEMTVHIDNIRRVYDQIMTEMHLRLTDNRFEEFERIVMLLWGPDAATAEERPAVTEFLRYLAIWRDVHAEPPTDQISVTVFQPLVSRAVEWISSRQTETIPRED
jgi:hypothetical protein